MVCFTVLPQGAHGINVVSRRLRHHDAVLIGVSLRGANWLHDKSGKTEDCERKPRGDDGNRCSHCISLPSLDFRPACQTRCGRQARSGAGPLRRRRRRPARDHSRGRLRGPRGRPSSRLSRAIARPTGGEGRENRPRGRRRSGQGARSGAAGISSRSRALPATRATGRKRRRRHALLHTKGCPWPVLQCRRLGQPPRGRAPRRAPGPHRRAAHPPRLRQLRRARLPALRPGCNIWPHLTAVR